MQTVISLLIDLIRKAFDAGQLKAYDSATGEFSNYIGWYADANDRFLGFYNEGTTQAPANAVYKNKTYGLLGETTGIKITKLVDDVVTGASNNLRFTLTFKDATGANQ